MSILRELFVKLGLDVDAQSFAKGQIAAEVLRASLVKVVDTAREVAGAFVENIKSTAEYGKQLHELKAATGSSTESLQQLVKAGSLHGAGFDQISNALLRLSMLMQRAKQGSEEARKALHSMGTHATDDAGKLRPAGEVMKDIAEKFHGMADGAEKAALARQAFGRGTGTWMTALLNEGRAGIEKNKASLSDEDVQAGYEVVELEHKLSAQTTQLWRDAIGPLLPAVKDLLEQFYEWKKANAEVLKQKIGEWIHVGIAAVKGLGAALQSAIDLVRFFTDNWKSFSVVMSVAAAGIILDNYALAASFVKVQWAAANAAAISASAWVVAAGPFVALGAVIAGVLVVLDDVRTYSQSIAAGGTGKNTMLGQLLLGIKEIGAPKDSDPWWLTALREAARLMEQLYRFYHLFDTESFRGLALGAKAPDDDSALTSSARARAARYQSSRAYTEEHPWYSRAAGAAKDAWGSVTGNPVYGTLAAIGYEASGAHTGALIGAAVERGIRGLFGGGGVASPELAWPAVYEASRQQRANVSITVHAAPGMSEAAVAKHVGRELDARGVVQASDLEAAYAAAR